MSDRQKIALIMRWQAQARRALRRERWRGRLKLAAVTAGMLAGFFLGGRL